MNITNDMKQFCFHDIAHTKDIPINPNSPFWEDKHGKGKGGGGEREGKNGGGRKQRINMLYARIEGEYHK